jgi:hypothetical protein
MIISIHAEKAFDKVQYHLMIKIVKKLGIEGMYLNKIKAKYHKLKGNITVNGEKPKPFPLKSKMRPGWPLFPFLLKIRIISMVRAIRQGERNKGIQIENEGVKLSLFADDMILYQKDPKPSTQNS